MALTWLGRTLLARVWQKIKTQRDKLKKHSIKIEALMSKEKEAAKTLAKAGQRECVTCTHRPRNHPFTHHHHHSADNTHP